MQQMAMQPICHKWQQLLRCAGAPQSAPWAGREGSSVGADGHMCKLLIGGQLHTSGSSDGVASAYYT